MIAALASHLWESSLFALAVACATLLFRNNGAHVRYWLWLVTSLKFLIPFSLLAAIGRELGPERMIVATPESVALVIRVLSAPAVMPVIAEGPSGPGPIGWTLVLAALWAAGVLIILTYWTLGWLRIRRALRAAVPVAFDTPIPVRMAASHVEPGLVGITRPVLLLPRGMTSQLTARELRAVLAHELCHLRRRDNLTAAFHMLAQALFWFHPLLWWIGSRLITERERACDEAVTRSGSTPEDYALGIVKVCKLNLGPPMPCVSAVSGANLQQRIERILDNDRIDGLGTMKSTAIAAAAALTLACPMLLGWAAAPGHRGDIGASPVPGDELTKFTVGTPTHFDSVTAPLRTLSAPASRQAKSGKAPTLVSTLPPPVPTISATDVVVSPLGDSGLPLLLEQLPSDVLKQGSGVVDLTMTVEPDGSVSNVVVKSGSGHDRLDETMRRTFQNARFQPGTVNGRARAMTTVATIVTSPTGIEAFAGGVGYGVRRAGS